jgi:hypothetical protein
VTPSRLQERLGQLRAEKSQLAEIIATLQGEIAQRQANLLAYDGAISETERWLKELEAQS